MQNSTKTKTDIIAILKSESIKGHYIKQQEIIDRLDYELKPRMVRKYIHEIREDLENSLIILTDYTKGYKLMSEEDTIDVLTKRKKALLKSLKLYYKDVQRFKENNNFKITLEDDEVELMKTLMKEMR